MCICRCTSDLEYLRYGERSTNQWIFKKKRKEMAMAIQRAVNIWTKQKLDVRFASSRSLLQKSIAITSNPGPAAKGAGCTSLRSEEDIRAFLTRRVLLQVRKIEWSVPLRNKNALPPGILVLEDRVFIKGFRTACFVVHGSPNFSLGQLWRRCNRCNSN